MSLWPEYPKSCAPSREDTLNALLRLAEGPSDEPVRHWRIGIAGEGVVDFPKARLAHHPGPGSPEFLLVWTPSGSHCYNYHEVDFSYVVDKG